MKPLIICRSSKSIYMVDLAKNLLKSGQADKLYAYVPYFDRWRDYLEKLKEPTFDKIFGTQEVFKSINNEPVDSNELQRIEKEYGDSLLWNLLLTERWLITLATRPQFSKIPYYTKEQKLQYFVKLICQFEKIFDENNIDSIIDFANIGSFRMALHVVAKKRNIPYYRTNSAVLRDLKQGDRYFIARDLLENYSFLEADHKTFSKNPKLIKEGWKYLESFKTSETNSIYSMWFGANKNQLKWYSSQLILKKVKGLVLGFARMPISIARDIRLYTKARHKPEIRYSFPLYKNDTISTLVRNIQSLIRYIYAKYIFDFVKEPLATKYAFMTLHFQPEASTALWAPFEVNQLAVIENVAKALPLDCQLMVKMNKMMYKRDPISFIRQINSLPNVHLVDHYANTRAFLENSHVVITITGTSGFEGALLGKKVILLGDKKTCWSRLKSVVNVKDWRNLHSEITKAENFEVDETDLAAYLQAVHQNSFSLVKNYAWESGYDTNDIDYKNAVKKIASEIAAIHNQRQMEKKAA